jgi:FkbM family methyltransferase
MRASGARRRPSVQGSLFIVCALCVGVGLVGCPAPEEPRVPLAEFLGSETSLYSQHDEEALIRHFFRDRRDGFFVDVGAFHWKLASTTLYLEERLGWTGISIDANRSVAAGYRDNRPGTQFENYFIDDESGGSASLVVAGPLSSSSEEHVRSFPGMAEVDFPRREVRTITLNDLLDRHGVEKIDFLSMDIELGEPAALAGFDIERYRPELVCIEAARSIRHLLMAYFTDHGYERIDAYLPFDTVNWYFTPLAPAK